jgi:hypothetical protein
MPTSAELKAWVASERGAEGESGSEADA